MKDITGMRFGRLVADEFLYYNDKHQDCWRFRCDCGNEKVMPAANVKWYRVQSCGCLRDERMALLNKQDITGKRFGRLVAVRATEKRDASGATVWECRCDCGNIAMVTVNVLKDGRTQSCGCWYQDTRKTCSENRKDLVDGTLVSSLVASKTPRKDNNSGVTGVYLNKRTGKWMAYITFQKKRYSLGSFSEKNDAIKARRIAEKKLHDSFISENLDQLSADGKKAFEEYLRCCSNDV